MVDSFSSWIYLDAALFTDRDRFCLNGAAKADPTARKGANIPMAAELVAGTERWGGDEGCGLGPEQKEGRFPECLRGDARRLCMRLLAMLDSRVQ